LLSHPEVRECLVFGAPSGDVSRNDLVVAVAATRTKVSAEELKQFLLRTLPAWQVPREWQFVDALPTNQRGKLSRAEWRQRFGGTNSSPAL
jgi:acyl-coenzyme A synthetase/AMP-(fatty) acid ligase